MPSYEDFRKLALSFPEASEDGHFEKISFRIRKKIFATYDISKHLACIKLTENDQNMFSSADRASIYPVDNAWGKQGWTLIELQTVDSRIFEEALSAAYCQVAPKKLAALVGSGKNDRTQ